MSKQIKRIHARIVFGGLVLLVGLAAWLFMGSYFSAR
jgi:hypothetical protein